MEKQAVDLILTGRYVLTMDRKGAVLEHGALAIHNGEILDLGAKNSILEQYQTATLIDEPHGLIMPGLVNVHTHAAMSCFRGLADDIPLMQWLQEYIFPREAQLTEEVVYRSTLLSICEMIKSGTTSFCDMYLFAQQVGQAAEQSGMRAWIGEVVYDFPSPNYGELENGLAYTRDLVEQYRDHDLIQVTMDPHAVYTCSPDLLVRLAQMAEEYGTLYNIHLSETQEEVKNCQQQHGCSPVEHLHRLGVLNHRVLAAHCVQLTSTDIELLAEQNVAVAHCQESNMKLASGIAPVPAMLEHGLTVGIGTDGAASNNDVDMFGEMSSVAKGHKAFSLDPTVMGAETTLWAATMGGAKALHAEKTIGSLERGKQADCIVLDLLQPHLSPLYSPVSHMVYAAKGSDVQHSVIGGRLVMRDRVLLTVDEEELLAQMSVLGNEIRKQGNVS